MVTPPRDLIAPASHGQEFKFFLFWCTLILPMKPVVVEAFNRHRPFFQNRACDGVRSA
jgi:hypothetical protein